MNLREFFKCCPQCDASIVRSQSDMRDTVVWCERGHRTSTLDLYKKMPVARPTNTVRTPNLLALTCTLDELRAIERGLDRERAHWMPSTSEGRIVHELHRRIRLEIVEAQMGMLWPRKSEGASE